MYKEIVIDKKDFPNLNDVDFIQQVKNKQILIEIDKNCPYLDISKLAHENNITKHKKLYETDANYKLRFDAWRQYSEDPLGGSLLTFKKYKMIKKKHKTDIEYKILDIISMLDNISEILY